MAARLVSVNVAKPKLVEMNGRKRRTAINKQPIDGPVAVGRSGLEGDGVASTKHHGGPGQAVYLYSTEDYQWWSNELDQDLAPATFGENLTVAGLDVSGLAVGDRLAIGSAVLELTAPRTPCGKLAARMGDPNFVQRFAAADRLGAYSRVITQGTVTAGDTVELLPAEDRGLRLRQLSVIYREGSREDMERALHYPIAERARTYFEEQLSR